jgi:ABC-type sugar transport system ATPase subunit
MNPVLEARNISKSFPGTVALDRSSLAVNAGEVLGLVGPNGAGKSTLIRILAGAEQQDAGTIFVEGEEVEPGEEQGLNRRGLSFIHQDPTVVGRLSVAENLFLGEKLPRSGPLLARKALMAGAASILDGFADVSPMTRMDRLSVAEQCMVCIARACSRQARVVVMDEPTVALSDTEVLRVFDAIRRLKTSGMSVVFVSHRLNEILEIADRVTIMRDGRDIATHTIGALNHDTLLAAIVGAQASSDTDSPATYGLVAEPPSPQPPTLAKRGEVVLRTESLTAGPAREVSIEIRTGEILGIAGLVGSGRSSLLMGLFGARPHTGRIEIRGDEARINSTYDAVKLGIALIPENRRADGLFLTRSIRENVVVASLRQFRRSKWLPFPSRQLERRAADDQIHRLQIKTRGSDQLVAQLSGGNQQKTLLARWLMRPGLTVLLLDEPTKGIDVGAKAELFSVLRGLADLGVAVVVVSSDLEELGAQCDPILVMVEGRVVDQLKGPVAEDTILERCYGHSHRGSSSTASDSGGV